MLTLNSLETKRDCGKQNYFLHRIEPSLVSTQIYGGYKILNPINVFFCFLHNPQQLLKFQKQKVCRFMEILTFRKRVFCMGGWGILTYYQNFFVLSKYVKSDFLVSQSL